MQLIKNLERRKSSTGSSYHSWGLFLCPYCLEKVERTLSNGKRGKSCGCVKYIENKTNYKHGERGTRLYGVWANMKDRCFNPKSKDYKNYGGRGITVCNEWLGFIPFRDWAIQNGYKKGLQIDRINNDGNYEPNNCRWVTSQVNNQNQRTTKLTLEKANEIRELYKTENYTTRELGKIYNVNHQTISVIINNKIWGN